MILVLEGGILESSWIRWDLEIRDDSLIDNPLWWSRNSLLFMRHSLQCSRKVVLFHSHRAKVWGCFIVIYPSAHSLSPLILQSGSQRGPSNQIAKATPLSPGLSSLGDHNIFSLNWLSVVGKEIKRQLIPVGTVSVFHFTEATLLCFCYTRPHVMNCSMQSCPHIQERTYTFFFVLHYNFLDWLCMHCLMGLMEAAGHYSWRCLANFCALTSTKMSSSRLTLASPGPLILWLVPSLPAPAEPGSQSCQQTAVPILFYLFILVPSQLPPPTKSDCPATL